MLYTQPISEDMTFLPSPESLKRKVIVKAKKQPPSEKENESESEEEEEAGKVAADMKANIREVPCKIVLESDIVFCVSLVTYLPESKMPPSPPQIKRLCQGEMYLSKSKMTPQK
jgi:hypothetical protein